MIWKEDLFHCDEAGTQAYSQELRLHLVHLSFRIKLRHVYGLPLSLNGYEHATFTSYESRSLKTSLLSFVEPMKTKDSL